MAEDLLALTIFLDLILCLKFKAKKPFSLKLQVFSKYRAGEKNVNWLYQKYHLCCEQVSTTLKQWILVTLPLSPCCCSVRASISQWDDEDQWELLCANRVGDCLRAFPNQFFLKNITLWSCQHWEERGGREKTPQAYSASCRPLLSPLWCPFRFCNTRTCVLAALFAPAVHATALTAPPYPLRGQINPTITLLVVPFKAHAFWRPCVLSTLKYVGQWPLSGHIHFNCTVKRVIFRVSARVSYLGLLDCKTVCEQTRHPKSSPFWRCFVYNTPVWTISQIPRKDYRDVRENSWWKVLCRQSLKYFIWHIRVKVFSSHYS